MAADDPLRAEPAHSTAAPAEEDKEVLVGGNSTAVTRRGEAVHRTAGPWSPTVHRLLEHLHTHGITFLPRPLGYDAQGQEVLTHLPGTVPVYPLPAYVWTPAVLATAGRQLAEVHAATRTFLTGSLDVTAADEEDENGGSGQKVPGGLVWQQPAHTPVEVICLNDVAPYNMVFDADGQLTGWIDVDTASPGPRVWDLAHLAYRLVPLTGAGDSGAGAPDLLRYRRRLSALCQAYATAGDEVALSPQQVLPVVVERLLALAEHAEARLSTGAGHLGGHGEHYRREAAWLQEHAEQLAQPPTAHLVVLTGPIASGKSTVAAALAQAASRRCRTAVVVDVDDVAEAVTAPGAGATGLWFSAHQAHGALVARWVRTPVDLVIGVGPIYSPAERAALLEELPAGVAVHWVLLDAPVATTLARAAADPTRGLSRDAAFHTERHARFQRLLTDIPAAQTFDTSTTGVEAITEQVLAAVNLA